MPALIDVELFRAAAEQLDENRRRYREQKQGTEFLLSGLLRCAGCDSAYCGRRHRETSKRTGVTKEYVSYRCLGTDATRHHGAAICKNGSLPRGAEEAVWSDLCSLLREPERLRREFEQRLERPSQETAEVKRLEQSIGEHKRRIGRLLDAYENGWVEKDELEPRIRSAKERLAREEAELRDHERAPFDEAELRLVIGEFDAFAAQMSAKLDGADFATKRRLLRLLIRRIEVSKDDLRVVYKVSLRPFAKSPNDGGFLHHCLMFQAALQAARLADRHCIPLARVDWFRSP